MATYIVIAAFAGGFVASLAVRAAVLAVRPWLKSRLLDPERGSKCEEDPYFNREYARPPATQTRTSVAEVQQHSVP